MLVSLGFSSVSRLARLFVGIHVEVCSVLELFRVLVTVRGGRDAHRAGHWNENFVAVTVGYRDFEPIHRTEEFLLDAICLFFRRHPRKQDYELVSCVAGDDIASAL